MKEDSDNMCMDNLCLESNGVMNELELEGIVVLDFHILLEVCTREYVYDLHTVTYNANLAGSYIDIHLC